MYILINNFMTLILFVYPQINENGIVAVNGFFSSSFPRSFESISQFATDLIAPFWSRVDVNRFGTVYYRLNSVPGSADFEQVAELTSGLFPCVEVNVTGVVVATWYRVAESFSNSQVCKLLTRDCMLSS